MGQNERFCKCYVVCVILLSPRKMHPGFGKKGLNLTVIRDFLPEFGAHEFRPGSDPHAVEIEPVGVPARGNSRVLMMPFARVPRAGVMQQIELRIGQLEHFPAQASRVGRTARPVIRVAPFVLPLAVVKQREKPHHGFIGAGLRSEQEPIPLHASPMIYAVDGFVPRVELRRDMTPEFFEIDAHRKTALRQRKSGAY